MESWHLVHVILTMNIILVLFGHSGALNSRSCKLVVLLWIKLVHLDLMKIHNLGY